MHQSKVKALMDDDDDDDNTIRGWEEEENRNRWRRGFSSSEFTLFTATCGL